MPPRKKAAAVEAPKDPGLLAALAWLDANWKHPLDRETLVRGIVGAYNGAANAKR